MTRRIAFVAAALALALAGCEDPYAVEPSADESPRTVAPQPPSDARPLPADDRDSAPVLGTEAQETPRAAVGAFCGQWANWSWRTIGRQQRRLSRLAAGLLARQLAAEATLRAQDQALRRDRLGIRGRVVAIDVKTRGGARDAVCVTREQQRSRGGADLGGARHRVYLATATRTPSGWAVRRWEPQP